MKKILDVLFLIFAIQLCHSQESKINTDTIALQQVVIKKVTDKKQIKKIIKQIKKTLRENYNVGNVNYYTKYLFVKDYKDTLANRNMLNNLKIKFLSQSEIQPMLLDNSKNYFNIDNSPFARFETSINNNTHGLALSAYHNSMYVIDFDFFNNISNYTYKITSEDNISTITFTGEKFFSGYFSFNNTNFNLHRVAFKNTKPYDWYTWGFQGEPRNFEFTSNWKYNKLTVLLNFEETNQGRILLKKLDAMLEFTQFEFKRYLPDSKRVIDQGRDINFYTTLSMKILD